MIDVLSIFVADMGRSLAFYRRLGLAIPPDADTQAHVEYRLPGGFTLMWDTHETVRSYDPAFDASAGGSMELAFRCAGPADVDRLHAAMVGSAYASHVAPFDAFWGHRYAVVVDPDGNHVALYAPRKTE